MQPATVKPQRKPMKVIQLTSRSRKPATGMCNLSFASVGKPASRKKPKKRVIEKLLPATAKAASPKTVRTRSNNDSQLAESLLSDVKAIFLSKKASKLRTQSILDSLGDKKPWDSICSGKRISGRRLAALLPDGIHSMDLRFEKGETYKGFKREWFIESYHQTNNN
jgi:hypothetical protein